MFVDTETHYWARRSGNPFDSLIGIGKNENYIASDTSAIIDFTRNILFLEDESQRIGKLIIPNTWYGKMQESKIIIIDLTLEERIINIAKEYVYDPLKNGLSKKNLNKSLQSSLLKIRKRLGLMLYNEISIKIQNILIYLYDTPHEEWIKELLINYYDPMYDYQLETKKNRCLLKSNKSEVIKFLAQIEANQSL